MADAVRLSEVAKHFGDVVAVSDLNLGIADGEFFSLLGPSGCGKTTTLRLIAGFEFPTAGSIQIHDREMGLEPPNKRPVNTVFQSYALFPHMNVSENVGFGLLMQKVGGSEIEKRVKRALDMVQLSGRSDARPSELSGGMAQRVALARALVNEPEVLLLDEPLGALDLKLRQAMQFELKELQERVGITFVYVTHDQEEALTMSDRIGVMSEARLLQVGTPEEIYEHPASRFVADFIGEINLLEATVVDPNTVELRNGMRIRAAVSAAVNSSVTIAIRPERFSLSRSVDIGDGASAIAGTVNRRTYFGDVFYYEVETSAGVVDVKEENRPGLELFEHGDTATVSWDPGAVSIVQE